MSDTEKKDKNYAPLFQAQERVPKSFDQVLKHVRLPLLTPYFLHDVVMRTPAVTESAECRALVEEAKETNQKISKVSTFVKEAAINLWLDPVSSEPDFRVLKVKSLRAGLGLIPTKIHLYLILGKQSLG